MSEAMELTNEALETIGGHVKRNLSIWMKEVAPPTYVQLDPPALERMIRMEESLSSQRDLLNRSLDQIDRRFSEQRKDFAARFEQIDKRFDQQREDLATRFDQQREDFAARFEQADKRFDDVQRHSNRWMTVITVVLGLTGVAVTVTNLM